MVARTNEGALPWLKWPEVEYEEWPEVVEYEEWLEVEYEEWPEVEYEEWPDTAAEPPEFGAHQTSRVQPAGVHRHL